MKKKEFYKILNKPQGDCDGLDLHLRSCWERNAWKSIFRITGLDFSRIGGEQKYIMETSIPSIRRVYIK